MLTHKNTEKFRDPANRDRYAQFFSYEHLLFNSLSPEYFEPITALVLGTDSYERRPDFHIPTLDGIDEDTARMYLRLKRYHLTQLFFYYSKVYEFCRVLGVTNVFDLGCMTINQGLMLLRYTNLSYTGVEAYRFYLNDYRINDAFAPIGRPPKESKTDAFLYPTVDDAPPPFADGRIRYIKGAYPLPLSVPENSIGVSMRSLARTEDGEKIREIVSALTTDFDRVLFDPLFDRIEDWKTDDWSDFTVVQVGPTYLYATKYPEDIVRLKTMYLEEDGRFSTGIGSFEEYNAPFESVTDYEKERIVPWNL